MTQPDTPQTTPMTLPRTITRWLLIIALALLGAYLIDHIRATAATDLVVWESDVDQALAQARESNAPLLVLATSRYCGPCVQLKSEVLSNPEDAEMINAAFVPLKLQLEGITADQEDLAMKLGVQYVPTLVVMRPDGSVISQITGFPGRDEVLGFLEGARAVAGTTAYRTAP